MAGVLPIKIKIRILTDTLSRHELASLTRIAAHYFPDDFDVEKMLLQHLDRDSCVQVAEQNDKTIGFSIRQNNLIGPISRI